MRMTDPGSRLTVLVPIVQLLLNVLARLLNFTA